MSSNQYSIATSDQMRQLGAKLGSRLQIGDVVALVGPLGAGKTEFTKGIASAFGIEEVTSPTFVIARSYKSNPPFIHMDAYRLLAGTNPLSELEDLDLDAEKAITVIEWGGEFANRISENFLEVQINRSINEDETRQVILISHGDRWQGFTL